MKLTMGHTENEFARLPGDLKRKDPDMVRVVRCKDCKYSEKESDNCTFNYFCHYDGCAWNNGDHFCSYGERDEEEA